MQLDLRWAAVGGKRKPAGLSPPTAAHLLANVMWVASEVGWCSCPKSDVGADPLPFRFLHLSARDTRADVLGNRVGNGGARGQVSLCQSWS